MADTAVLQARLAEAEAAYHKLMTGALEASVGAGDQSVTFSRVNVAELQTYMADLKRQIAQAQGLSLAGSRRMEIYF